MLFINFGMDDRQRGQYPELMQIWSLLRPESLFAHIKATEVQMTAGLPDAGGPGICS